MAKAEEPATAPDDQDQTRPHAAPAPSSQTSAFQGSAEPRASPTPVPGAEAPPPDVAPGPKRRRSRFRKALSRYSGYAVLRIGHAILCRLPLPVGCTLARAAGSLAYLFAGRERRRAIENLTRVFGGERSPAEIRALARGVFQNLALTMVEWVILRRWPKEKLLRRFPQVISVLDDLERDVRAGGSGGIGLCAHCGNWEVLSLFYGRHSPGFLVPVANRIYFDKYQDFFHSMRTGCGLDVIYSDESPRRVLRAVKEGRLPSFLPDVDLRTNSGVFVDFFGVPAYTVTFPMEVARKLDVPWVLALLIRDGSGYSVFYSGAHRVPRTADSDADLLVATQEWTHVLEGVIRQHPEQWSWVQDRWRTTPDRPRKKTDRPHRR